MDVVRTAIERLGGRVVGVEPSGQGTVVRFTLPFTVMMTRVLTVEAAGQVFGMPMEAVVETVRVARDGHRVGRRRAGHRAAQPHDSGDRSRAGPGQRSARRAGPRPTC